MVRAAKFPHRHSCIIHQVPFCKLPRTNRLAQRGASGPAGAKEKAFDVEVVEIRRRFPWALLATAAGTAGLYAVYLRRQEELRIAEEEAAKLKAEAAATQAKAEAEKSQAEATAKAAALAEAEAAAAREAEAREAAEAEAKLQAEKQAALAATFRQGEQFLNRIRLVENGANYYSASDAHNEDLHELLASVQAFVDQQAFQDLQQAQGDKSELASKLMSSLSFLRLFLERLQTADKCEQQFDSAASLIRAERRRWLAGEAANLALVQDALTRAEASVFELQGLGMESSGFDEVIEMARSNLQEMKDQESKKQLREVAGKALEAAMDSSPFDCKVCEQSAKEARSAGCLPSAALEVAERVAELNEPRSELKNWASEFGRFGLEVSSSASSGTVDAEDFVTAAVSATASMSDKELQDHVSRLAEALAMHHEREKLELSSAWTAMLPEWSRLSQEKILKIREDFATRKRLGKETMKTELEETASLHLKEALEEAVGEVQERSERDVYDLQSSSMLQLSEDLHKAIRSLDGHLRSLPEFFTSRVQELWNQGRCPQHRVSMTSYSAAATLSVPLGSPLKSGDVAKSDGFVGNVASHLASHLPQGASALSAEELQHAFHRELPELVAAAFEPEHGGMLGNLVGKLFGRLYRFRGGQDELSMQEALESKLGTSVPLEEGRDVQKNLRALAEAFKWIELGEFRRALSTLDSLVGQCRARAEDWIHLAREALLLRQASDAVRARSRCLSMSLVE